MTRKVYFVLILILGSLTALGPFSIDMYLPGFAAIAKDLQTDVAHVSLTLSSYFVGISLGQLAYGPLLDRYGRKKPLYAGLLLYLVASLACAFSRSIEALIAFRFVQAVGSCAASVASRAMVRDLFPLQDNPKVFSLLMLIVGVSPMIAPTVGGYLTAGAGWPWVFVVLAAISAAMFVAVYVGLPESIKPDKTLSLRPKPILRNFVLVARVPQFYTYTLCASLSFAGLLAYVAGSPVLFMEQFGTSEKVYGWIFAFLSVGLIGASQVNSFLLKFYTSEQLTRWALCGQCLITLFLVLGTSLDWLGLYGFIACLFLFLCCLGFNFPNASALSMAPFAKNAGSASALMGAAQMGAGALATLALSLWSDNHSPLPMAIIMMATSGLALLILLTGRKRIASSQEQPGAITAGSMMH